MIELKFQLTNLMGSVYFFLFAGLVLIKISRDKLNLRDRFWEFIIFSAFCVGLFKALNTQCVLLEANNVILNITPLFTIFFTIVLVLLIIKKKRNDLKTKIGLLFSICLVFDTILSLLYFKSIELAIFEIILINITILYFLRNSFSFKKRYYFFICTSLVYILVTFVSYFIINKLEDNYKTDQLVKVYSKLEILRQRLIDFEKTGLTLCKMISINQQIKKAAISKNKNDKRWTLKLFNQMCRASYVWLMDKSGTVTLCSDPKYEGYNYAFRPYFKKAIQGIANVYYARGVKSDTVGAFFARPVIVDGIISAVLVIKFDFSTIWGSSFKQNHIFFMHKSGAILFGPDEMTDVLLYSSPQNNVDNTLKVLSKQKVFGQRKILRSTEYKLIKKNLLQDKEGYSWILERVPLNDDEWYLATLYSLNPIFQYRIILLNIFLLLSLIHGLLCLRVIQTHEFISSLKKEVDERKRLERIEALLVTAIEQTAESIIITDAKGIIQYVNPAFIQTTGYSREEVIGQNPRILQSGKHDSSFYKQMWATISNGQPWHGHFINKKKDGSLYEEVATISPIKDDRKKIINYVAVKRDVTQEKKLKEQLFQAQKMESIGVLAGGIAHDFNNILMAIQGYVDISLTKIERSHPVYKNLVQINSNVSRATDLVRQLLLFGRKQQMDFASVDLNKIVANIIKMLQRLIGADINISTDLSPDLWPVQADARKLEQIIVNLAINARDAMPDGGKLNIKTENVQFDEDFLHDIPDARAGKFVCLSVTDIGSGMDEETLKHIFEPFFTTKERGKGSGLGLAVVYGIVKEHKGWINVYSEEGQGTVFKIYLPAQDQAKRVETQTEEKPSDFENLEGKQERVLVVEDEEGVRDVVATVLRENGYTVFEAATASEALEIFNNENANFELVISDMILPDQNGLELVEQILSSKPEIAVILSSGYTDYKSHWPVIQKRGFRFLQKPYPIDTLLQTVKEVLDRNHEG
ncbi:PAS domain S-box protein [Desulfohalobiaceae bacterium Ax17]|uniref:PAS domain S-box protein n=1 Tax=Desulfovulcanus ferrireducens TaxID=2831190 RepID=UPI00207BB9C8|nr:PAS domain S-box protein [Desulfovulcanus ferrireducens]MBT8763173.1 PAS domain S-box protein [Desulfovulcanus ferrireducens]